MGFTLNPGVFVPQLGEVRRKARTKRIDQQMQAVPRIHHPAAALLRHVLQGIISPCILQAFGSSRIIERNNFPA
ncbi:hypothetical protein D3C81_1679190 [compost metagenome]